MKNPLFELFDSAKGHVINSDDMAATTKHVAKNVKKTSKKAARSIRQWYQKQKEAREWWNADI